MPIVKGLCDMNAPMVIETLYVKFHCKNSGSSKDLSEFKVLQTNPKE